MMADFGMADWRSAATFLYLYRTSLLVDFHFFTLDFSLLLMVIGYGWRARYTGAVGPW